MPDGQGHNPTADILPFAGVGGDYRPRLSIGGGCGKVWPSRSSLGPSGS